MREDIEGSPLNTWSGEFSLAITDCQKYLQVNLEQCEPQIFSHVTTGWLCDSVCPAPVLGGDLQLLQLRLLHVRCRVQTVPDQLLPRPAGQLRGRRRLDDVDDEDGGPLRSGVGLPLPPGAGHLASGSL